MSAPLSVTSSFALYKQTSKGVAGGTDGVCGRFQQSNLQAVYEYIEADAEHFCGLNLRPTVRKTTSYKSGYSVQFGAMGLLYSDFLGMPLLGLGFVDAVSGTGDYVHEFTVGNRADHGWLTALQSLGDGADKYARLAVDSRIEQLRIDVGPQGMTGAFTGVGIEEKAAAGTETPDLETDLMLLPSKGAATINLGGLAFAATVRGLRLMISNPLDKKEQALFSLKRGDLAATGLEIGGVLQGIDMDYATYKKLMWGGVAGTGPVQGAVSGDIDVKFESAGIITGGTKPAALQAIMPKVEFRLGQFQARGRDLVRGDIAFLMIDDNEKPVSLKLTNGREAY
jgi:hypothetical protein